jgi:hypothetical protein
LWHYSFDCSEDKLLKIVLINKSLYDLKSFEMFLSALKLCCVEISKKMKVLLLLKHFFVHSDENLQ